MKLIFGDTFTHAAANDNVDEVGSTEKSLVMLVCDVNVLGMFVRIAFASFLSRTLESGLKKLSKGLT